MLKITYIGHSCFILDDGTYRLIIDPFITNNSLATVNTDDVKVDYIVLTHAHGDHIGDTFEIAKRCNAMVICINEIGHYLDDKAIKNHKMHIGGGFNFPFGRLKFTIAHHGSWTADSGELGNPAGVVIKFGGKTVYHCGDTGLFLDMKLIGELDKIDIMMLPIGDNFTMGIDDAVIAVDFVNPALAIPMHYNTFEVIEADPHEFVGKVSAINKKARVMEFGETIEF